MEGNELSEYDREMGECFTSALEAFVAGQGEVCEIERLAVLFMFAADFGSLNPLPLPKPQGGDEEEFRLEMLTEYRDKLHDYVKKEWHE